jgi:glycosyltransferase involved in cell wall biosynthesis
MKTLFISYNGASEPLMQSQGVPYLKGLADKGVECFLLSFEKKIDSADGLKQELNKYGIKWRYLRYHKNPSLPATLFDIVAGIFTGLYIVISENINIIHSRATVPAVMGYVIARLTGKKFIFDVRGLMAEEYADGDIWKRNGFLYNLTLYVEKKLLCHADKIVVLTENIKDFLIKSDYLRKGGIKSKDIIVVPCCVDMQRFNAESNDLTEGLRKKYKLQGKFIFLYIGSVGTWYLLDKMMDFFIAAKSIVSDAHFVILTHVDKDMAISAWGRRGLSLNDITVDDAEFHDMPYFIKMADAGLFFIKPCFSKRFSSPTKLAEYLACGLPVVINLGIGDTEKIVSDNRIGVVVSDFNNKEYLDKTKELLAFLKEGSELSKRCRVTAEKYLSLSMGVKCYYNIYRELVK